MVTRAFYYKEFIARLDNSLRENDAESVTAILDSLEENRDVLESSRFISWLNSNLERIRPEYLPLFFRAGVNLNLHDGPKGASGTFPLEVSVRGNDLVRSKVLLENGANPNLCDALFAVHLIAGGESTDRIRMSELLINFGADVNRSLENIPGYTPIAKAKDEGDDALVLYLTSRGGKSEVMVAEKQAALNLNTFQSRLEDSIRACWTAILEEFPADHFCMFGLETDSDCVIVNALLDSQEAIDRRSKRGGGIGYLARVSLDSDSEFYGKANSFFRELSDELNSMYLANEDDEEMLRRRLMVLTCLEGALSKLDQSGMFGVRIERERFLLLVSIIDADEDEWTTMLDIINRLNPTSVAGEFRSGLAD